jgi:DNA-binding NarL/FixJ family response regulator
MTRIVIADDQALFREGLRTLLSARPDMDVVGEAATGDEAVALVEQLRPWC